MRMKRNSTTPVGVAALLLVLLSGAPAQAQQAGADERPRTHAGVGLALAQPLGEFKDYVRVGGGIHGFLRLDLDEAGFVGLRMHGGFLNYGNETQRVCFSAAVGCRVELDLTTSNNIFLLGIGPEVGVPLGASRLYGNASIGLGYFSTESRVGGTVEQHPFATTRNYGDGGLSWSAGGGIELFLTHVQQLPLSLDLGVSYQGNGRREYLTRGGIIDRPDGSLDFDVKRSQADFLLWRLGVSVGIRPVDRGGSGRR